MPATWLLAPRARCLVAAVLIGAACGSRPGSGAEVDCGTSDLRRVGYDAAAVDCFWRAFSAGRSVVLRVTQTTVEGDQIPMTLTFDPATGLVATRDVSADKFSSAADRRVWTWRCKGITRTPSATGTPHTFFELANCTGDGSATSFP